MESVEDIYCNSIWGKEIKLIEKGKAKRELEEKRVRREVAGENSIRGREGAGERN